MSPFEFEQQIGRIERALVATDSNIEVKWNDRIPDPDNKDQLRQVDISIRRDDSLTLVECRLRSRPQDVQWIEELYGRKVSLTASAVIAVSSSGFTKGAIAKASRLGVFLRTLDALTESEVSAWGKRTTVTVSFVQLSSIVLSVITSEAIHIPISPNSLCTDKHTVFPISGLLTDIARKLAPSSAPEGRVTIEIFLDRVFLATLPVHEALLTLTWRRLHRQVALPILLAYENIETTGGVTNTVVEKNSHSETEVYHGTAGVFATVDLDALPFEPLCILTGAEIQFSSPINCTAVEIIGPRERAELFNYEVQAIRKSDPTYRTLRSNQQRFEL